MTGRRGLALLAALAVQLALVAAVAGPRLVVRLTGTEYRVVMEPFDPIDPLRGAYVDLRLRGLPESTQRREGTVFVRLIPGGNGLVRGAGVAEEEAPARGPYLRCDAGDGGFVSCGVESFFASQGEARRLGARAGRRPLTARVRVGLGGRAVLVGLE